MIITIIIARNKPKKEVSIYIRTFMHNTIKFEWVMWMQARKSWELVPTLRWKDSVMHRYQFAPNLMQLELISQ